MILDSSMIYIDGAWTPSASGETLPVQDPTTGDVIGAVPAGAAADVDAAVHAARAAFDGWSGTTVEERATYLDALGDLMEEAAADLAALVTREVGTPIAESRRLQVDIPIALLRSTAAAARDLPFEERVGASLVVREPAGVVGCITAWNYPVLLTVTKVAAALAAGCTVVLKPSEVAPLSVWRFAELVHAAGLPAGVFNLVSGDGPTIGNALASHPDVDMVSFTGSTAGGTAVSLAAAPTVKRVALELGGKSASILLEDADLERAVAHGVASCFQNGGQTCTALTRMLVPRGRLDTVEAIAAEVAASYTVGDPLDPSTRIGPLATQVQRSRVEGFIRAGIDEGARLVTGGPEAPAGLPGSYIRPTVFSDVRPTMTIAREEIFGPVLSIVPYADEEEAIAVANASDYGLSGGVWSQDEAHAGSVARRLRTGQVQINGGSFDPMAPFGGYKRSGIGRERGRFGIEEYLETKALLFPQTA